MPLELRPETEAYRLCQPMHVLSFGEGRWVWKRLLGAFAALGWRTVRNAHVQIAV
jgi:hypothetical protein